MRAEWARTGWDEKEAVSASFPSRFFHWVWWEFCELDCSRINQETVLLWVLWAVLLFSSMVWTVSKYPVWMNAPVGACHWTPLRSLPFWCSFRISTRIYSRSAPVIIVLSAMLEKQDPLFTSTSNRLVISVGRFPLPLTLCTLIRTKGIWNQKNFVVVQVPAYVIADQATRKYSNLLFKFQCEWQPCWSSRKIVYALCVEMVSEMVYETLPYIVCTLK